MMYLESQETEEFSEAQALFMLHFRPPPGKNDVLRDNKQALRAIIMYEFLQHTPINQAYKRFCMVVGQDVMKYPEFEYYFYGIGKGTLDLNSEMPLDIKKPGLSDMPRVVVSEIVDRLEQRDRLVVRKLNRKFRTSVDRKFPKIKAIRAEFFEDFTSLYFDKSGFEYMDLEDGCMVTEYDRRMNGVEGGKQIELALGDLERIVNNPKVTLETFLLLLMNYDDAEVRKKRYEELCGKFQKWSWAKVETLMLGGLQFKEVGSILANFDAKNLSKIQMDLFDEDIGKEEAEEVAKLEQWKNAKVIGLNEGCKLDLDIANFLDFDEFTVALKKFTVEDAVTVREKLLKTATFQTAIVHVDIANTMEIARVFEPQYTPNAVIKYSVDGADFNIEVKGNMFKIERASHNQ